VTVASGSVCFGGSFTIQPSGAATYTVTGNNFVVSPAVTSSYSITGTSADGCISGANAVAVVSVIPLPVVSASGGTICQGNNFTVTPSGANTYSISGGSFIVAPQSNTVYYVGGTNFAGCKSAADASVSIIVNILPTLSIAGGGSLCAGGTFTLTASGAGSYTWNNVHAVNPFTVMPGASASYTVTGLGMNGCEDTAITHVTILNTPTLNIVSSSTTICAGEGVTITALGADSVAWSNGSSAAQQFIKPAASKLFTVVGVNKSGCKDTSRIEIKVDVCAGWNEFTENRFLVVYPNPTSGRFNVESRIECIVEVYDVLGEMIISENIRNGTVGLDLGKYPAGMYVVIERSGSGVRSLRLLKE
jgi:hypothetical protein